MQRLMAINFKRKARWLAGTLACFCLLTGCFRPHYVRQYVDVPCSWRLPTDESSTLCNMRWWEQFDDPVLNELILKGLENNQDLKIAIHRVFEYYAILGIVDAALYPALYGNVNVSRNRVSGATPLGLPEVTNKPFNNYQATLNLSWELDFWGRVRSASDAAYADLLSKIEARRGIVITVVSSIANAYVTLRGLDAQLEVATKTLKSRQDSLELAKDRFHLGETSELEVVQAEAELEIAAIRKLDFEMAIPLQENLISVLMGENPHDILRGRSIEKLGYPPSIPAGLPSDLISRRPDIMEAEDQLIAVNARVSEAKALLFPQFSLTGEYGSQSSKLANFLTSPAQIWQYGVNVVQTIFDAGRTLYQIQATEEAREEALYNYRQVILTAFQQVNDALVQTKMNQKLVAEHANQVKVLVYYVELATLRYLEGEVDYLNVLDAERSLFDAQLSLIEAQMNNFNSVISLYSALGGGWVYEADSYAISENKPS